MYNVSISYTRMEGGLRVPRDICYNCGSPSAPGRRLPYTIFRKYATGRKEYTRSIELNLPLCAECADLLQKREEAATAATQSKEYARWKKVKWGIGIAIILGTIVLTAILGLEIPVEGFVIAPVVFAVLLVVLGLVGLLVADLLQAKVRRKAAAEAAPTLRRVYSSGDYVVFPNEKFAHQFAFQNNLSVKSSGS